jgi:hypothetical protein
MTANPMDFQDVGDYKDALEKEGRHLHIFICWRISVLMKETGMTVPEAWKASIDAGAVIPIPRKRKRRRSK